MTMQAGKKLDEAVAAQVMGFTVVRGTAHIDGRELPWTVFVRDGRKFNSIPFSTDIAAAFSVVERFHEQRLWMTCSYRCGYRKPWNRFGWIVQFRGTDKGYAEADTLPLAICLAALAAVSSTPPVSPTDKQE